MQPVHIISLIIYTLPPSPRIASSYGLYKFTCKSTTKILNNSKKNEKGTFIS